MRRASPGLVEQRERGVGGEPDDQRVGDRAEPGHLPQRDPQQQHQEAAEHHGLADGDREALDQAGVQHVPGARPRSPRYIALASETP